MQELFDCSVLDSHVFRCDKRPRKPRVELPRVDFSQARWQVMLTTGTYKDPTSREGRQFRRKFRLPADLFNHIVAVLLHRKLFREYDSAGAGKDAYGRAIPSLQVKVLCVFRVVGSGCEFAAVYDGSLVDEQAVRKFFYRFNYLFSRSFYREWIHIPSTEHELKETLSIYQRLGLPGAIGSTDCFHLFWDRCPAQLKVDCRNGRYNRCSLVWSVSNDHHRKIYAISQPFNGCISDKTISQYDGLLQRLHRRTDPLLNNARYTLFDELGHPHEHVGAWILCDNGYHKWECMQMPISHCTSQPEVVFREVLESARCDV